MFSYYLKKAMVEDLIKSVDALPEGSHENNILVRRKTSGIYGSRTRIYNKKLNVFLIFNQYYFFQKS